jgi:predicted ATPase/DNA-binding SARP family transcriptional activator/Tfp pilus assembly protein PilF
VQSGIWVERDRLAALFWPGRDLASARHNLRKVIFTARELPGTEGLETSPHALRWNVLTDLSRLQLGQGEWAPDVGSTWRGRPLEGLDDSGNAAWSDWLANERARALALWQQAVHRRLQGLEEPAQREALARCLLQADALDETAAQALVAALAATGRQAEARRFYADFVQRLHTELGVEPSHALRDLAAASSGMAAPRADIDASAQPAPGVMTGAGSFVGRRLETRQIVQWLGPEACRLLVVVGPGGMGKSRMAQEAQAALSAHFKGAVHGVALDDLQDLPAVVARIAAALGVALDDRVDAVQSLLRGLPVTPLLLILDNAEHLPGMPALLQRLLASCSTLQLLVTSRERLHLAGERVLVLGGLDVPDADSRDAEAAASFDAVALFVQGARAAQPQFDAALHMDSVVAIVDLLGGMPLAIQLASAWVRLLAPEAILRQLRDVNESLDLLQVDPARAGTPARAEHTSLRTVLAQSWQRLAPREAEALADLVVFAGGFMPDAARAVARVSLPVLATLADKSLLLVSEDGRFGLHPVVAAFAAERLLPEREALLRDRHANFYCRQLWALAPHARGRQRVLVDGVNAEFANARAAWAHALAAGQTDLVLGAANVWRMYHEVQGRLVEGQALLRPALQLPAGDAGAQRAGAVMRNALAMLSMRLGHLDDARELAQAAITTGQQLQDVTAQTGGWLVLGNCALVAGQLEQARAALQQALACARAAGDRHGMATATGNLGILEKRMGHADAALALYRQALEVERELDNQQQVAMHLNNIAALQSSLGQWDAALQTIGEARSHCQRHGVALLLPYLAFNHGVVALEQGQMADARLRFDETLAAARHGGQRQLELGAEIGLARVDVATGAAAKALPVLARVAALARADGMGVLAADTVGSAGEALLALGRMAAAARCLAAAAGHAAADARARARWAAALQALPGPVPASPPEAFEDCLQQLIAGRFG